MRYTPEEIHKRIEHIEGDNTFDIRDIREVCKLAKRIPEGSTVFEIGSRLGRSACVWALAIPGSLVRTLDVHDNREIIRENAKKAGLQGRVIPLWGHSLKYPWTEPVDVVFIDGDHDYNGTMGDLQKYYPLAKRLICGHDYMYDKCPDVKRAVDDFFFNRKQPNNIFHAWKSKPLFVTGIARTGTTIAAATLNTHPDINMTSECLLVLRAMQFLNNIKTEHPLLDSPHSIRLNSIGDYNRVRYHLANGLRQAIEQSYEYRKYEYYGDKLPEVVCVMTHYNKLFPDAKYIITYKPDFEYCLKSALTEPWSARAQIKRESFKHTWDRSMALIDRERNNPNVYILDYNSLVSEPAKEMEEVATFLNMENKFDTSLIRRKDEK